MKARNYSRIVYPVLNLIGVCFPVTPAWVTTRLAARSSRSDHSTTRGFAASSGIDYQVDCGRGEDHLTANLQEGDVVVYQTGTWYVDGVAVGDGSAPAWHYLLVDTLQIVWSHNCEHGVVRGFDMVMDDRNDHNSLATVLRVQDYNDMIDFGPEQLVARISVEALGDDTFRAPMVLSDDLWTQVQPEDAS